MNGKGGLFMHGAYLLDAAQRGVVFMYKKITEPSAREPNDARKEYVLNILLVCSSLLMFIFFALAIRVFLAKGAAYRGVSPYVLLGLGAIFASLFFLSRRGFSKFVAGALLVLYIVPTIWGALRWGVDLPQGLLSFVIIISISAMVLRASYAFLVSTVIALFIIGISYLHTQGILMPLSYWRTGNFVVKDGIAIACSLLIISIISWLSNRETERSFARALQSEAALKKERDSLEEKVQERTRELQAAELKRMTQMMRFVEFGRLASGFFHDLTTPLSTVMINLELLMKEKKVFVGETYAHLEKSLQATKRIEEFLHAMRKPLQVQERNLEFSVAKEIAQIINLLFYKARQANVELVSEIQSGDPMVLFGNPLKFSQIVINLIANAIDAYENGTMNPEARRIRIRAMCTDDHIRISVTDWGKGIDQTHIQHIFCPFFTTKGAENGLGIGLTITKHIVQEDFQGSIAVTSHSVEGTVFVVEIPQKKRTL